MEYQEFININARVSGSLSRENYVKNKYPEWYIELCKFREDLEAKGIKESATRKQLKDIENTFTCIWIGCWTRGERKYREK